MKLTHLEKHFLEFDHVEVDALLKQNDSDKESYVNVYEKKTVKKTKRTEGKQKLDDYATIKKALGAMSAEEKVALLKSLAQKEA